MSSSSHPLSSPLGDTNTRGESGSHTPPLSAQSDLQRRLSKELHHHAWQFDAERIAEMLSANGESSTETLVNTAYRSLHKVLKNQASGWPTVGAERAWNLPIATFLNNCVSVCRDALRDSKSASEIDSHPLLYDLLKFIVYNKITGDGVEGASPVKPDLVGGLDLEPNDRVAWSPENSETKQVLLPVEVKAEWAPMVIQAATYARCLFSASPSRQFAVVLGFRHTKAELRFLVFHRGGLTGSKPLSVKDEPGQKDILRILLSVLNWRSAEDAGFTGFYNNFEMSLFRHEDDKSGVVASVAEVLHDGLCIQGRASRVILMSYPTVEGKKSESPIPELDPTAQARKRRRIGTQTEQGDEVIQPHVTPVRESPRVPGTVRHPLPSTLVWSSALETDASDGDQAHVVVKHSWCEDRRRKVEAELLAMCKDDFGTPDHYYSFCPTDTRGAPMSTARFLPANEERPEDFHWAITSSSKVPSHPQHRDLWIHVSKLVGRSLVHAKTPWELHVAIGHAMLGWLEMLRRGFLQRDVSIGNTLMLDPPVTMNPFDVWEIKELMKQLSLRYEDEAELTKYAKLLYDAVKNVGYLAECHGFLIDGDMAASLKGYFTSRDTGEVSGTREFMSDNLLDTLRNVRVRPYLHSPIEDLHSFYYTAQWAAAFNDGASGRKHDGIMSREFREMIAGEQRLRAVVMAQDLVPSLAVSEGYSPFFAQSLVLLGPWWAKFTALNRDWKVVMSKAGVLQDKDKEKHLGLNFLIFGYRGVVEYFELLHEHRASLQVSV